MYGYYWSAVDRGDEDSARKMYMVLSKLEERLKKDDPMKLVRTHVDISSVCIESGDVNSASEHLLKAYEYLKAMGKQDGLLPIIKDMKPGFLEMQHTIMREIINPQEGLH